MSQLEWHEYPDWHESEPMWSITFVQYSEHFAERSTAKSEQTLTISERPDMLVFDPIYTATSRMAPANDIARQLVADGMPDAPMHVYTEGLKDCLVWQSFHKGAGVVTYEDSMTKPVHMVRWRDPAVERAQMAARTASKQGVKAPAGTPMASEASHA